LQKVFSLEDLGRTLAMGIKPPQVPPGLSPQCLKMTPWASGGMPDLPNVQAENRTGIDEDDCACVPERIDADSAFESAE